MLTYEQTDKLEKLITKISIVAQYPELHTMAETYKIINEFVTKALELGFDMGKINDLLKAVECAGKNERRAIDARSKSVEEFFKE